MPDPGPVVLDTHVWIWHQAGDPLPAPAREVIRASAAAGSVLVAAISLWELGMLTAKGRISLADPCLVWTTAALAAPGFQLAALTPEIAIDSTHLPGNLHGDPADRLIVATARVLDATLVTRDAKLLAYAAQGHVRAVAA